MGNLFPGLFSRLGIYLWGKTDRLPWRPWETAIIASGQQEFRTIENRQVAIYHWGQGKQRILLLPGWNSRASHFKKYIEKLSALGYSMVGVDPIGHGHSSGNWTNIREYLALIDAINKEYGSFYCVIGHSFGGFCIPYALNHFAIAEKAVLIGTPDTLEWLFMRYVNILRAPLTVQNKMRLHVEQMLGKDCWQVYSVPEQAKHLSQIPALFVHDRNDHGVPFSLAENNQAAWPGASLLETKQLGHHRTLRHPSAIKPVIEFLQKH